MRKRFPKTVCQWNTVDYQTEKQDEELPHECIGQGAGAQAVDNRDHKRRTQEHRSGRTLKAQIFPQLRQQSHGWYSRLLFFPEETNAGFRAS